MMPELKFCRVPDYFVARYLDFEIADWFNTRPFPSTYLITFNEGALALDSPCAEQGKVLRGAWLLGRLSRKGLEIEPLSQRDEEAIAKHCTLMTLMRVPPRARLVEPLRPGIPILPDTGTRH